MTIHEIAFRHVNEKLQSQRQDLLNIRNQAAISVAVTGLTATVFASFIEPTKSVNGWIWPLNRFDPKGI